MKYLPIVLIMLALSSCRKDSINCGLDCRVQAEEQIFQTGFKNTVLTNGEYANALFSGSDPDLVGLNDWAGLEAHPQVGYVEIGYEDGDDSQRRAYIVDDPDSAGNDVMKFQIMEPHIREGSNKKGRIQLAMHVAHPA